MEREEDQSIIRSCNFALGSHFSAFPRSQGKSLQWLGGHSHSDYWPLYFRLRNGKDSLSLFSVGQVSLFGCVRLGPSSLISHLEFLDGAANRE